MTSLKSEIVVNIRGGNPLRIPVLVNTIIPELFIEDQLHLKPAGYVIWTKVLTPYLKP